MPRKGQISDENYHKGTADSDNEKKKLRSRKERLRDKLPEQDRTMKSDSKKLKLSSAKEEGKSEVPKLEESVKKQKPVRPICEGLLFFLFLHPSYRNLSIRSA